MDWAKVAYDAYCETTGWKSAITGADLPPFNKTPIAVQAAWSIAAEAVRRECIAELEEARKWQPIETAPVNTEVLLYCPYRCVSNTERIEVSFYRFGGDGGSVSQHPWATHWQPLPEPPKEK